MLFVARKLRRKKIRPYLLKVWAFVLSNEDQMRAYFEERAREARDPVKVPIFLRVMKLSHTHLLQIRQTYSRFDSLLNRLKGAVQQKHRNKHRSFTHLRQKRNRGSTKLNTKQSAHIQDESEEELDYRFEKIVDIRVPERRGKSKEPCPDEDSPEPSPEIRRHHERLQARAHKRTSSSSRLIDRKNQLQRVQGEST